jgi:hypothetical protein
MLCASPLYYSSIHLIKENPSFKLLPSQDVQSRTSTAEDQSIKSINNVDVTMFNKYRHAAKVNIIKILNCIKKRKNG